MKLIPYKVENYLLTREDVKAYRDIDRTGRPRSIRYAKAVLAKFSAKNQKETKNT